MSEHPTLHASAGGDAAFGRLIDGRIVVHGKALPFEYPRLTHRRRSDVASPCRG
jgi:hypothetical protein